MLRHWNLFEPMLLQQEYVGYNACTGSAVYGAYARHATYAAYAWHAAYAAYTVYAIYVAYGLCVAYATILLMWARVPCTAPNHEVQPQGAILQMHIYE